jgi:hypothetical protein
MNTLENVTFKLSDLLIFESAIIIYSFLLCSAYCAYLVFFLGVLPWRSTKCRVLCALGVLPSVRTKTESLYLNNSKSPRYVCFVYKERSRPSGRGQFRFVSRTTPFSLRMRSRVANSRAGYEIHNLPGRIRI